MDAPRSGPPLTHGGRPADARPSPADARPGEAGVVDRQGVHPSAADPNHAGVNG